MDWKQFGHSPTVPRHDETFSGEDPVDNVPTVVAQFPDAHSGHPRLYHA
jgi:hypothetical protein